MTGRIYLSEPGPKYRAAMRAASKIALRGGALSRSSFHRAEKPWCDEPVLVGYRARGISGLSRSLEVSLYAPCRKCEKCRTFRRWKWVERMESEGAIAPRTWFLSLTFDPITYAGILAEARSMRGWDFDKAVERVSYRHVQLYLKRVRALGAKLRYFAVLEQGKEGGRWHYHLLIHEVSRPVTHSMLSRAWRAGYFYGKLCASSGEKAPRVWRYISKYLTKGSGRARASARYGQGPRDAAPPQGGGSHF